MNLTEKLSAVVSFLDDWRVDYRKPSISTRCNLIGPNHTSISCRLVTGNRIRFYACTPYVHDSHYRHWDHFDLSFNSDFNSIITCAFDRKHKALAADLKRRMIIGYLKVFPNALNVIKKERKVRDELEYVTTLASRIVKGSTNSKSFQSTTRTIYFKGGKIEILSYNGGALRLEYKTNSYEQGLKLASFLGQNFLS